ncbi:hypothetical protein HRR83_006926 [Exophiala dermatitidis]|uniref:SsDNA binding protein Ssb3 n=2 Tax=Exophiala dermatitidis TaxID=5970 RepID=H6BKE7_EXODN|nr:uncharacterized protein HMPREF1120_00792 [Exophiala dermatitidis NIH/UT8656]KAJ4509753.1 hypothetical protein HRR75_005879 [Exophiala dermatitidis]EHY52581.1 hypothetical protein HMPREF1120_00792 [Exophiala dermatitidis NIH/UT8656]KAJ4512410.1 hypothetical protein HRR73_005965 [Exophiala dermatitidis]KAJ4512716.1 hypothetical protein HRR74_006414 [Exophiala dermatitidis]KAJ4542520.1 hypothetical protein HRR77_005718 [Exophiala dermatitidis]
MASSMSTPRILPGHLHAFAPGGNSHNTVRMLGTITTVSGDQATLTCGSDAVTILLNRDSHLSVGSLYEIVGKVVNIDGGQGLGLRVLSSTEWPRNEKGELPDIKLFEAVVDVTHRYKSIFYDDGEAGGADGGY